MNCARAGVANASDVTAIAGTSRSRFMGSPSGVLITSKGKNRACRGWEKAWKNGQGRALGRGEETLLRPDEDTLPLARGVVDDERRAKALEIFHGQLEVVQVHTASV